MVVAVGGDGRLDEDLGGQLCTDGEVVAKSSSAGNKVEVRSPINYK